MQCIRCRPCMACIGFQGCIAFVQQGTPCTQAAPGMQHHADRTTSYISAKYMYVLNWQLVALTSCKATFEIHKQSVAVMAEVDLKPDTAQTLDFPERTKAQDLACRACMGSHGTSPPCKAVMEHAGFYICSIFSCNACICFDCHFTHR